MIRHLRHTLLAAFVLLLLWPASAQPLRQAGGEGPQPAPHPLALSGVLERPRRVQRVLTLASFYRDACREALAAGDYRRAAACTDSLIRLTQRERLPGIRLAGCYRDRAEALWALGRKQEACKAFAQSVLLQESIAQIEQSKHIGELQTELELDRLALDEARLKARHHKTALTALVMLLAAAGGVVVFIYRANRRTKLLQRELLLEMERARESEQMKTAFINSICHEVRTPLNCIAGFSELLCDDTLTPEAYAQYCEIIHDNRRQLRYMLDDLLEVAYLENLAEPLPCRYMDLGALCRARLRVMKVRYAKPDVVYEERIPDGQIALIGSEKYLTLLLAALLDNAYKFTQRGTIRLECDREGDDRVRIAVTDTGCGIPSDKAEYVFERFTKIDTFSPGNGLGLYLCRLIVRHLGGRIAVDPAYTAGTRVVVSLPRRPEQRASAT